MATKTELRAKEVRAASENMRRLILGVRSLLEAELRSEGMSLAQLRVLKAVDQNKGVSSAELARACLVTPQSMQSLLTRAVREGWLTRSHTAKNDRILTASLTPLGRDLLRRGMEVLSRTEQRVWNSTRLSDLKELNRLLAGALEQLGHHDATGD